MNEPRRYFDLQVNGYFGVDFLRDDMTADELHTACEAMQKDGVAGCLATITTAPIDNMCRRLRNIAEYRQRDPLAKKLIPAQLAMRSIVRRGLRRGELRPGQNPFLVVLFLLRMEAELLDLVPVFSMRASGIPPEVALPMAERAWFEVFWRGVAAEPLTPLPFLPELP